MSLAALTAKRDLTDVELLSRAKELHDKVWLSVHGKVMFSDIALHENLLHVDLCIILLSEGLTDWGIFKPNNSLKYPKTCFFLLCDEHYYGVKEVRKIFGVRNFCKLCHTLYNRGHSFYYYCQLCLSHDHAFTLGKSIRYPSCNPLCSSGECLQRGTKLWLLKKKKIKLIVWLWFFVKSVMSV